jgi:hypothetical protein
MSQMKRPAPPQDRPSATTISDPDFTRLLGLPRHEPLDAETRAELELLAKAAEMGFRLATRCSSCGAWISNPVSIRRHLGPVCAKKAVTE